MSIVVESCLGTSKHQFILMLSPTYDALMPRQLRLETKYFMSEISGKITKTIASQSSPSKRSKAYGASSKARPFPAPVGADTYLCKTDILELFSPDRALVALLKVKLHCVWQILIDTSTP